MRAVIERVVEACVNVNGVTCGAIGKGLLVYLGVQRDDAESDVAYMADKIGNLRIFSGDEDRMNCDVKSVGAEILVISAFSVQGDARKGRRPSFETAATSEYAHRLYELTCGALAEAGLKVARGCFGASMAVRSINDGPVCILLDSRRLF